VAFNSADRDVQLFRDLGVRPVLADESQHLGFTLGNVSRPVHIHKLIIADAALACDSVISP